MLFELRSDCKVFNCTCQIQGLWCEKLERLLEKRGVTSETFLEVANRYLRERKTALNDVTCQFSRSLWGRLKFDSENPECLSSRHLLSILELVGIKE